jgi:hypothetical protein
MNPYTEDEMRLALRKLVNGTFNLNVPAQDTDADLVIARSITELIELRAWKEKARPFLYRELGFLDMFIRANKDLALTEKKEKLTTLTELLKEAHEN